MELRSSITYGALAIFRFNESHGHLHCIISKLKRAGSVWYTTGIIINNSERSMSCSVDEN